MKLAAPSAWERSAVNSHTAVGAFLGVALGLWSATRTLGTEDPESLFALAGLVAMPFALAAHLLVARLYRRGSERRQRVLAISGWVALFASIALLIVVVDRIFPKG